MLGSTPKRASAPLPLLQPSWTQRLDDAHPPRSDGLRPKLTEHGQVYVNKPTPGMPAPPPVAYGNPAMMGLHAARYGRMEDVSYHPERYTTMLNGRPWQVLLQTHDECPAWEWLNNVGEALAPLQVITLLGVKGGGSEAPRLPRAHSCMHWFKAFSILLSPSRGFIPSPSVQAFAFLSTPAPKKTLCPV